ncbi:MAG: post-transcriptional regulator [Bacilli bacterium]|nr:post-transcriptional regulator [Bacilli bacterium]MDD3895464.1 post-transcriptional regulator [Bacilli bacterium]MDD4407447.1 post-transcriptional regulator [Bacilli bacterium]
MEDFKFNTLDELYQKLYPALVTKTNDLKRNGINYIKEADIWNYLRKNYWNNSKKITLFDLVNDILSTPNYVLEEYVSNKIQKNNKDIEKEEIL